MNLLCIAYSAPKPGRYYVDGRRVTRDSYYDRVDEMARRGRLQNSFCTRLTYDRQGNATARHYSAA